MTSITGLRTRGRSPPFTAFCRADVYEVRHEDGDHELEAGLDQYEGHAEKEVSPILVQTGEETLEFSHP